jgi:hypothetical protein
MNTTETEIVARGETRLGELFARQARGEIEVDPLQVINEFASKADRGWYEGMIVEYDEKAGLLIHTDGSKPIATFETIGRMDEPSWTRFVKQTTESLT